MFSAMMKNRICKFGKVYGVVAVVVVVVAEGD
jgi:hypothetical protein